MIILSAILLVGVIAVVVLWMFPKK